MNLKPLVEAAISQVSSKDTLPMDSLETVGKMIEEMQETDLLYGRLVDDINRVALFAFLNPKAAVAVLVCYLHIGYIAGRASKDLERMPLTEGVE